MSPTDSPTTEEWLRILKLGGEVWLGLVDEELFVGDYEAPKRRIDLDRPTGLLPCLERPREAVIAELRARETDLGLDEGALTRFVPLDAILGAAVLTEMDYWVQLALDWLAEMNGDDTTDELIGMIESASWATQRARHRATRLRNERRG